MCNMVLIMLCLVAVGCAETAWRTMPELVGLMYSSVSSLVSPALLVVIETSVSRKRTPLFFLE